MIIGIGVKIKLYNPHTCTDLKVKVSDKGEHVSLHETLKALSKGGPSEPCSVS